MACTALAVAGAEWFSYCRSAEGLLTIINDILDFSKVDAGKLDLEQIEFDLRAVVEDVGDLLAFRASDAGLDFSCYLDSDVPARAIGDGGRLRQILINLTGNAIKFTRHGSVHVRGSLERGPEGEARLGFRVTDTGIGIPEEARERLFDFSLPLVAAESSTARESLGLAGVRALVLCDERGTADLLLDELALWGAKVESAPNVRAALRAALGGHESRAAASIEKRPTNSGAVQLESSSTVRSRLLLVEDNPVNRRVAILMLEKLGHEVLCAANCVEALELLEERGVGAGIDLVLMDCQMPHMDGYEATRRIRALEGEGAGLPIIAMTANAMNGDREKCLDAGMDDYVTKPVRSVELERVLGSWLERPAGT